MRLRIALAAILLGTLGFLVTAQNLLVADDLPTIITVDGVTYEATKVSGPTVHFETPDTNPSEAFTERNVWVGNGSEQLPCEGGIHWIDNENVLTISNCLPSATTTTTGASTTTSTESTTTTSSPTTTTTVPSTTTTTTTPTTTTSEASTTTSTTEPATTTTTTTTTPPSLPFTGPDEAMAVLLGLSIGFIAAGVGLLLWGRNGD